MTITVLYLFTQEGAAQQDSDERAPPFWHAAGNDRRAAPTVRPAPPRARALRAERKRPRVLRESETPRALCERETPWTHAQYPVRLHACGGSIMPASAVVRSVVDLAMARYPAIPGLLREGIQGVFVSQHSGLTFHDKAT